ncbi:MAG: RES family NAD+ phosphorylase [Thermoanaerobaculia bacterium]
MGHFEAPLDYPPYEHLTWRGRYDDVLRDFRTLYASPDPLTCLREKLAPFRLSLKMSEERRKLGRPASRKISPKWRQKNALAPAKIELLKGELFTVFDPETLSRVEENLKDLLIRWKISRLDLSEVLGARRRLTRNIARIFFDSGAAGVLYRSRLDGELCVALFEGRARLVSAGDPTLLSEPLPELDQVCKEFRLDVTPSP